MRPHSPHVLIIGSAMIDLVNTMARAPHAGETLVGTGFRQTFGGKGANQAVMAALCGARVTFVGRVGDDAFGANWPDHLQEFGIDTAHLRPTVAAASGIASVWVEASGENRIVLAPGANTRLTRDDIDEAIGAVGAIDTIVAQLETPEKATLRAFWHAHDAGIRTILNPAPVTETPEALFALTDWLVPNENELRALAAFKGISADDDLALLVAYGTAIGKRIVVTLGARGAAYFFAREMSEPLVVPAPAVQAIDTTGAGDAFIGTFAVSLSRGDDVAAAMRRAVAAASFSVTQRGTTESYPRGELLTKLMND